MSLCYCSHRSMSHEMNGVCTIRGCRCLSYAPLAAGQGRLYRNPLQVVAADLSIRKKESGLQVGLERFGL